MLEACSQGSPGAMQTSLCQHFEQGKAGAVRGISATKELVIDRIRKAATSVGAEEERACKQFADTFGSQA